MTAVGVVLALIGFLTLLGFAYTGSLVVTHLTRQPSNEGPTELIMGLYGFAMLRAVVRDDMGLATEIIVVRWLRPQRDVSYVPPARIAARERARVAIGRS